MHTQEHMILANEALTNLTEEVDVKMTGGEIFLYHILLQDFGITYTGEDRFIPLMERSKERVLAI